MNIKDFFDSIGLNGTKWQWRVLRWQRAWEERDAAARGAKQRVTYRHKFCNACGALMDREDKRCPHCNARAPSWRLQVAQRTVGLVMPTGMLVSGSILLVNTAVMLALVAVDGASALLSPSVEWLARMGGLMPIWFLDGAYPLIISYGYLHSGIVHFGFNMFVLSQIGPQLEGEIGKSRFFALYTLALIGGGAARVIATGYNPFLVVGASGAMFGLIGFGISYAHFKGGSAHDMRNFFARWAFYAFLFGILVPGIDNVAHAGGFVVGLLMGVLVERERINRHRFQVVWSALATVCLLATLYTLGWAILRAMTMEG